MLVVISTDVSYYLNKQKHNRWPGLWFFLILCTSFKKSDTSLTNDNAKTFVPIKTSLKVLFNRQNSICFYMYWAVIDTCKLKMKCNY